MWLPIIISICALILSVIINACLVAFLLGKMSANQESIKLLLETHKEHTTEHFKRLEIVEQASKSAHHREDEIVKRLDKLEECRK